MIVAGIAADPGGAFLLDGFPRTVGQANRLTQAFAEHALESWEFDVLAALRRAGEPYELSPGRLLKETLVTSGTMTNRVDRLESRGLVERLPDPTDRRGVLVRLTPAGRTTVDGALEGLLSRERDLLGRLDTSEQRRLAALLRTLVVPFESGTPGESSA
jgi:DNA-binding MarR family transcriptional regulator